MNAVQTLERAAVGAHHRAETFSAFWEVNAPAVREIEPHNRRKFGQLYRKLMYLCICGNDAGMEPLGDDCPWVRDDEQHKPSDVGTTARWQGLPEEIRV